MSAVAGISAGASLLSGVLGFGASSQATQEEEAGLNNAAGQLQTTEKQALGNLNPYLQAGSAATGTLAGLLGTPGSGLLTPWTQQFQAPTAAQAEQTPGYQFQLQQGEQAVNNSQAANGGLLSGNTLAGLNNYAQGLASTNYQNTFSNAQTQYQDAYQTFLNNQQNQYNMLAGQSAQGLSAANTAGNITTGIGGDLASLYGQKGTVAAQGTIAGANALSGGLSGASNSLSSLGFLNYLSGANQPAAYQNPTVGALPFTAAAPPSFVGGV